MKKAYKSNDAEVLNKILTRTDIKRIDIYSAKKIIKKDTDLNSVLKPLTNSDSPSEKSKGERFVSAKDEIKRRIITIKRNLPKTII